MNYIDTKYISLISPRLRNFTKKGDYLWNFSCPFCGDSQKNQRKARGFIYRTKNDLFYKCHNCSHGTNLSSTATMAARFRNGTVIRPSSTLTLAASPSPPESRLPQLPRAEPLFNAVGTRKCVEHK